jgi:hypothetical protein
MLPRQHEPMRDRIEQILPPIRLAKAHAS